MVQSFKERGLLATERFSRVKKWLCMGQYLRSFFWLDAEHGLLDLILNDRVLVSVFVWY